MTAPASTLRDLVALVARLRAPDGCPWDREQRLPDVRAYLIEETHEAAAALDTGDWPAIGGELGDLLFQVAFVLRLGEEAGALTAEDVVAGIEAKMVARHPHVFGDERLADAAAVREAWERRKVASGGGAPLLAGVPSSLPALVGAYRLAQKAAGVGFDWPDAAAVLEKVREELAEVEEELAALPAPRHAGASSRRDEEAPLGPPAGAGGEAPGSGTGAGAASPAGTEDGAGAVGGPEALEAELGDLLFAVANLARHLGIDPERALAGANAKFRRRFGEVERRLAAAGRQLGAVPLDELEELWQQAKAAEGG